MATIRRSPCETYIKFLFLHPARYSNDTVLATLMEQQLDFISPKYLDKVRAALRPPPRFDPRAVASRACLDYMESTGVYRLFHPDKATHGSKKILLTPRLKFHVEKEIINGTDVSAALMRIGKEGLITDYDSYVRYKSVYFNPDNVDITELRALMSFRSDYVGENEDHWDAQLSKAMRTSGLKDDRRLAAEASNRFLRQSYEEALNGSKLPNISLPSLSEAAGKLIIARVIDSLRSANTSEAAAILGSFASVADKLLAISKENQSPDASVSKNLSTYQIETASERPPHVSELMGTVQVQDTQKSQRDEEE